MEISNMESDETIKPAEGVRTHLESTAGTGGKREMQTEASAENKAAIRENIKDLREEIAGEKVDRVKARIPITDIKAESGLQLRQFEDNKAEYEKRWVEMFGHDKPVEKASLADKATVNIRRWFDDMAERRGRKIDTERLKQAEVEIVIESRDAIIRDFEAGKFNDKNTPVYEKLVAKELAAEANANNFVRVKGLTRGELHYIIEQMGQNPIVFLSDPRGENAGRIAIDNALVNGEQPFGINSEEERKYWQAVIPNPPGWLPDRMKRWMMSRTHGVIYGVEDDKGNEEFLIPIHVDPKNAVAAIREIFTGKKKGERAAMDYHQGVDMGDENYLGTGQYDLGCLIFVQLMERAIAEKDLIGKLTIEGADKLRTTGSISGDDLITWEKNRQYKEKKVVQSVHAGTS